MNDLNSQEQSTVPVNVSSTTQLHIYNGHNDVAVFIPPHVRPTSCQAAHYIMLGPEAMQQPLTRIQFHFDHNVSLHLTNEGCGMSLHPIKFHVLLAMNVIVLRGKWVMRSQTSSDVICVLQKMVTLFMTHRWRIVLAWSDKDVHQSYQEFLTEVWILCDQLSEKIPDSVFTHWFKQQSELPMWMKSHELQTFAKNQRLVFPVPISIWNQHILSLAEILFPRTDQRSAHLRNIVVSCVFDMTTTNKCVKLKNLLIHLEL